jgi:hypothetical protein
MMLKLLHDSPNSNHMMTRVRDCDRDSNDRLVTKMPMAPLMFELRLPDVSYSDDRPEV